ncbi:MAG TPA: AAA family ATPase, partial [Polyangia bacterium]
MEERLHKRVIGQNLAVEAIANAVRRARAGLQDPHRPIGSFIFLGPTGVGKTELARALAEFLFDDETHMVRIDMSEYMEKHSVSRLIGAPPGYIGYDEGGQLTEAVRRRPYSVVLFDEIEKAHGDVFGALLQLLDDGRLTDGQGRTVDFKNTVIIMTSNVGSHLLLGASPDVDAALEELRHTFRPEFLNRVDEIVVFERLTRDNIDHIVDLQMERFRKLLAERDLAIELLPEARAFLAEKGYDPTYGARPLKRTLMTYLQNPLAKQLIAGAFLPGDTIVIARKDDGLEFSRKLEASGLKTPRPAQPGEGAAKPRGQGQGVQDPKCPQGGEVAEREGASAASGVGGWRAGPEAPEGRGGGWRAGPEVPEGGSEAGKGLSGMLKDTGHQPGGGAGKGSP